MGGRVPERTGDPAGETSHNRPRPRTRKTSGSGPTLEVSVKLIRQTLLQIAGVASATMLVVAPVAADDATVFAPIQPLSGIPIELRRVASGFTSPLKGKVAPGEPGRLYIVDQVGKLWAVELSTG